jgi:hypothetical protein
VRLQRRTVWMIGVAAAATAAAPEATYLRRLRAVSRSLRDARTAAEREGPDVLPPPPPRR